jgi:TorA maturation chaperone TorD
VKAEYFDLFEGLGRSRFLPYASYYMTGSLYGEPLARLREALQRLGLERAAHNSEPEDHAAILCEVMARLAGGDIAAPAEAEREIFGAHLAPWMGRFFADLERVGSAEFYARVGAVGPDLLGDRGQGVHAPGPGIDLLKLAVRSRERSHARFHAFVPCGRDHRRRGGHPS